MTTIDDIPESVLGIILASCLPIQAQLPPQPSNDTRLILPSVCPKWRNIIVTTPTFWQNIIFNPLPLFKNPLNLFNLANTWLERSGCLPLSIEFGEKLQYDEEQGRKPKYVGHLLFGGSVNFNAFYTQVISTHAARIRRLTCNLITKATIISFLSLPPGFFQNLEALNIKFIDEITLPSSLKFFTAAERANFNLFCSQPQLRIVVLEICSGSGMRPLYLNLPWHQLTNLMMDKTPICPGYFLKILKTSPSLVDGFFNIVFSGHSIKTSNDFLNHVTMPHLESLRLRLLNPSADPRVFDAVHLPALRIFWLELVDVKKGWDMGLYKSLLLHSTNTLQSLALWNSPDPKLFRLKQDERSSRTLLRRALKLETLLHVANNVDRLWLPAGVYIDATTLKKIATGELLPFLRYFKVNSTSVSFTSILDVVRKRYESFVCASQVPSTSQDHKIIPPFSLFSVDLTIVRVDVDRGSTASNTGRGIVWCYQCYGTYIRIVDQ